jgi:LEA14-like dessication related protein
MNFKRISVIIFTGFVLIWLAGCSDLLNLLNQMNVQEPKVNFSQVKMTGLTFDKVDLLFDIDINNPNSVGINLAGFDYDLFLNQNSFLKGDQQDGLEIKANGKETVKIPLSLDFKSIYQTFQSVKDLDSINYELKTGLSFNLPALGNIRIPVSKSGYIPSLKLPSISLNQLKLDKISFTGADLSLKLNIKNPNAVSMLMKNLNYTFDVSGSQWVSGKTSQSMDVNAKSDNIVTIPLSLNFLNMGRSAYNLLSGNEELNYQLQGNADLGTSIKLLGDFKLPFDQSGKVKLFK